VWAGPSEPFSGCPEAPRRRRYSPFSARDTLPCRHIPDSVPFANRPVGLFLTSPLLNSPLLSEGLSSLTVPLTHLAPQLLPPRALCPRWPSPPPGCSILNLQPTPPILTDSRDQTQSINSLHFPTMLRFAFFLPVFCPQPSRGCSLNPSSLVRAR